MGDHSRCCGRRHERPSAQARASAVLATEETVGSIGYAIADYAHRVRFRLHDDLVERHARQLHARASYDCWNGLSVGDQELWRHMARLDLTT
jgi:hypothetical protein